MNQLAVQNSALQAAAERKPLLAVLRDLASRFITLLRSTRIQRRERRMHLMERLAVGNKQHVVLLKVDGKEIVVGCSADSLVLLSQSEQKQPVAQPLPLNAEENQRGFTPLPVIGARVARRKTRKAAEPAMKAKERNVSLQTGAQPMATARRDSVQQAESQSPESPLAVRVKKTARPKLVKPAARKQHKAPASQDTALLNSIYGKAWICGTERRVQ